MVRFLLGFEKIMTLLGGIGMFLFGMNLLSESLQKMAGASLEKILEKLTNSKIKGVTLGTLVTGIIQSSAATSIMVIGFLNAGIMKLSQAIPVIMGANIGSTVTGQILRLGDLGNGAFILKLFKPSGFAPFIVLLGSLILLFAKKRNTKNLAHALLGFGILFFGMVLMEQSISPLAQNESFKQLMVSFQNPLLGMLAGMLLTMIIQSSSASVGILQAMSSTGLVNFSMAIPIILGQNIGKCFTVWLGCIGTNKKAKRAALIHFMFNVFGAIMFLVVIYSTRSLNIIPDALWIKTLNRGNVADLHTFFNFFTTLVLLPLTSVIIKISGFIIKDVDKSKINQELGILEDRFTKTPSIALEQVHRIISSMGETAKENLIIAEKLIKQYDQHLENELQENEHFLDKAETMINEYMVKVTNHSLTESETRSATEIMHTVGDFERIGDYCVNIYDVAEYNFSNKVEFSDAAKFELEKMFAAAKQVVDITVKSYKTNDCRRACSVEPLEEVIDELKEELTIRHIERLQSGKCTVKAGISFVEAVTNLERISDHCSNIAVHMLQRASTQNTFDAHEHLNRVHSGTSSEYNESFKHYESLYLKPVKNNNGQA